MIGADDGDGPAWTVERAGHTARGWPWFLVRKRGGQLARVTVHGAQGDTVSIVAAIDATIDRMPPRPSGDVY